VIMVVTFITALVFATSAAKNITNIKLQGGGTWRKNKYLQSAHSMLTWLAVGGWIAVALIITAFFIFFMTGGVIGGGGLFFKMMLVGITIMTLIVGVLGILAAEDIKKSTTDPNPPFNTVGDNSAYTKARHNSILAASLGIGVIGLTVIMWIMILSARHAAKTSGLRKELSAEEREEKAERKRIKEEEQKKDLEERSAEARKRYKERKARFNKWLYQKKEAEAEGLPPPPPPGGATREDIEDAEKEEEAEKEKAPHGTRAGQTPSGD